ncbi:hypothetical protein niasHT_010034 [Heterodera trifolii]|uniref:DDRGK domain-containing protein 1 n=1 Tax=Heterodera trifolii TaxID=157864 RepID=A0ABD2M8P6_9BILA
MDGLFFASIAFLTTVFSVIGIAIMKLWLDERNSRKSKETLMAMDDSATDVNMQNEVMDSDEDEQLTGNGAAEEAMLDQEGTTFSEKRIGKKKLAKLQAKAEAKALREQEQTEREERKQREEEVRKEEEKKRQLEEEEQRKRAEKRRIEKEEKERREMEEYLKIKGAFEVHEQGFDYDENEDNSDNLLESFVNFVRKRKVVHVDELASNFKSKSTDIVDRLKTLLQQKRLIGLFDDRGLFVSITEEELLDVAKFINQRGRVHLAEIVEQSKNLISLESF